MRDPGHSTLLKVLEQTWGGSRWALSFLSADVVTRSAVKCQELRRMARVVSD